MKRPYTIAAILLVPLGSLIAWQAFRPTASTTPEPAPAAGWFRDVTDQAGIRFVQEAGDLDVFWMPRINGSGVAMLDFDNDGLLDLFFLNFGGPGSQATNRLYRNIGGGTFEDVSAGSGLDVAGHNTGVVAGDVDNDGLTDLVVTQFNGVRLFRNTGAGRFKDVTAESGLKNPLWATSASLLDYDRDGWLDLVIVNYVDYDPTRVCHDVTNRRDYCGPQLFPHTVSKLFHNLGAKNGAGAGQPRFQDVTVQAGLATAPGPGLGVFCADFDGDGWQDIFVANDLKANHLWMNQKNGTFREEGLTRGIGLDAVGSALSGMGVAVGDVDNDGLFDVYVTHMTGENNTLWKQGPKRGLFRDQTAVAGLLGTQWRATGWGTVMADFDNDGWLDIAIANGRVNRDSGKPFEPLGPHFQYYGERNQVLQNAGAGQFTDRSTAEPDFCRDPNVGRGLAVGDLDGDGALDLVVTTIAGRSRVLRNAAHHSGHWLNITARDPRYRRAAYGAEVIVRIGTTQIHRIVQPSASFQSCSDSRAHFGLGSHETFDSIEVRWPDGLRESFPGGSANRVMTFDRGSGVPARPIAGGAAP